jgi:predicted DNA-binding transcriptional regulator YafY
MSYKPDKYIGYMRRKPFKAVLHTKETEVMINNLGNKLTRLEEGLYEVEFYDVDQLIRDLIISNQWNEIKSPNWLKDKLKNYCKKIYDKL